jgi:hypothetical protein
MSKFLRKCFLFLGLLVGLNLIYLLILLSFSPELKKIKECYNFKNQNNELLVFGNSMALDGIDSEYLTQKGIQTYNFAVAGDHISTSLMQLEEYLKYNKKPKSIIIGFSSVIGRAYLNKVPFKNPEVEFFYNFNLISNLKNPPLLNFQWLSVELFKILISKDHRNAKLVRGQWKTEKIIADKSAYKKSNVTSVDYNDPYLVKILDLCDIKGINAILIDLPGENAKRNDLPFVYETTLSDNRKTKVYNLNNYDVSSKIIDSSKDWLATDHLNQFGARKITEYLFENILNNQVKN